MASVTEKIVQPLGGATFPMSYAVVGSVIPGAMRKFPVIIVNYPDHTSVVSHKQEQIVDPVKQHPTMGDEHTKGHPLMEKLKQMLHRSGQPQMKEGYERLKEDLSWRHSVSQPPQIKSV